MFFRIGRTENPQNNNIVVCYLQTKAVNPAFHYLKDGMRSFVILLLALAVFVGEFDPALTPFSDEIDIVFALDMHSVLLNISAPIGEMATELIAREMDFRMGATTFISACESGIST